MLEDLGHNLYIRRLPGPSPRPLEGFQPAISEVFQDFRGEKLPEEKSKNRFKKVIYKFFIFFFVSFYLAIFIPPTVTR